jgi:molecular chaperone DnaJ
MNHGPAQLKPFGILGIPPDSSPVEIRAAFLKLAKTWHPDVCDHPEASTRFAEIQWAYQTLKTNNPREASPVEEQTSGLESYRRQQAQRRAKSKAKRWRQFGGRGSLF